MRNTIALQNGLIVLPAGGGGDGGAGYALVAGALQAELMNLGFALDAEAFDAVRRAPREWLTAYFDEVIPHLRAKLGAGRAYRPFYANFPVEVMAADAFDLFLNAVRHYWSDGRWQPPANLAARGIRLERTEFKTIRLGTEADFRAIFARRVAANTSLTEDDKAAIAWFVDAYPPGELAIPKMIPFKETLCLLVAKGVDVPVETPTDVLRVAVYLSGGDVSLPAVPKVYKPPAGSEAWPAYSRPWLDAMRKAAAAARDKFKFKKFKRPERRRILELLERTHCDPAEMQRHLGRWVRLGEVLHVGEMADRYPKAAAAFARLRNQHDAASRVRTFNAAVDLAFARDWREGVALLATRPGEFARRLDWMLRTFDVNHVLAEFERVGPRVSPKVLFEMHGHFASRVEAGVPRAVMIKGRRSVMKTLPPLPPMERDTVQRVGNTILGILRRGFERLPTLGRVWVDERLRRVPVPFAMRGVNAAVRTYVRGTRVPFAADAKVVRAFVHWFDEHGGEDLDLSVGLYDGAMKSVSQVSFTNLRDLRLNCCHSGDVRHRQGPCAEYADVDVARCLANGVRYAAVQVYNYDGRPMHTVKECVFGLMPREHAEANEVFVPRTISDCMKLANEGTSVVACVLDLQEREYVWADIEASRLTVTLEGGAGQTAQVLAALVHNTRMTVYELLVLHARARGTLVADAADADAVMRWEDFVTDYARVASFMTF